VIPSIILSVETDELGINAGLQDRVIQTYEGCVYMDFNKEFTGAYGYGQYETIDPRLLPKLYIAYKTDLGKVSGKVLNDIMSKYLKGDKAVIQNLGEIASLAEQGKQAILNRDFESLGRLMNRNFDLRSKIMNISDSNKKLIATARACGASAKFTGSGGSIIGIYKDDDMLKKLMLSLKEINARVIKPIVI
jgi:glucuronokinase